MSKLKVEHGVSKIRRAKLQSSIDQTVADDIELLAQWSNNETNYVINELLRFALNQEEDFQKYKATSVVNPRGPPTVQSRLPHLSSLYRTLLRSQMRRQQAQRLAYRRGIHP